jgi:Spy/CpxP family protein refolding chaperone
MGSTNARFALVGACLVLVATPLVAQQPAPADRPMRPMASMPMMECPMMSAMMHGPAAALGAATALGLSPAQRTQLQAQQRQVDAATKPAMDSMQVIHAQLMALARRPQLDERAARAAFDRMGRVHTETGLAMLRASRKTSDILTPVQRDSLAAIVARQMPKPGAMPMHGMPMHPMHGAGAAPKH